jgi:hypothetical protein
MALRRESGEVTAIRASSLTPVAVDGARSCCRIVGGSARLRFGDA